MAKSEWYVKEYSKYRYYIEGGQAEFTRDMLVEELSLLEARGFEIKELIDREGCVTVYARREVGENERKKWFAERFGRGGMVGMFDTKKEADEFVNDALLVDDVFRSVSVWMTVDEIKESAEGCRFEKLIDHMEAGSEKQREYWSPEEYWSLKHTDSF